MVTLVMAILLCFSFANAEGTSDYKRIKGSCAWYGCNNVSDSSGSWYCSSHMCSYSGCEHNKYCYTCDADAVTWNILGNFSFCGHSTYSSYCKNHACPKKGCSNDNSCPLHAKKCVITGCTYYVVDKINGKYASYCPTHKCAIEGCAYQKGGMLGTTAVGSLSQYCKTHTCDITKCKNPVSCQLDADGYPYKNGGNFICDTHTCSDSKCNNIVYCPTHKGSFDKCSTLSHSEGISVYCEKHRDTALTAGKDDATSTDGVDSTKNKVTQEELDSFGSGGGF